jgi:hypothetical protein
VATARLHARQNTKTDFVPLRRKFPISDFHFSIFNMKKQGVAIGSVKSAKSVAFLRFSIPTSAQKRRTPRIPQIFTDFQKRRGGTHGSGQLRAMPDRKQAFRE